MKRLLALLLAAVLFVTVLSACSGKDSADSGSKETEAVDDALDELTDIEGKKITKSTEAPDDDDDKGDTSQSSSKDKNLSDSFDGKKDVAYVMIYNPSVYSENSKNNKTMSTGKLSKWIDTNANRADGLAPDIKNATISQKDLFGMGPELSSDGVTQNRAGALVPTYKKGDKKKYYYTTGLSDISKEESFTCAYVGEKCYIWTMDNDKSLDQKTVEKTAKEFDKTIYDKDISTFGKPRYVEDGAKVCILLHPMEGGVLGYFMPAELLTEEEIKFMANGHSAKELRLNAGEPVIHVYSKLLASSKTQKEAFSTVAHEFQHMINFSSSLKTPDLILMDTWLNESMSGYIEEVIYPGVQKDSGRYLIYENSKTIRKGQSLYNFDSDSDTYYGVYGSVWLFSEYLNNAAGKDIFTKIHKYWRSSKSSKLTVAEAIHKSASTSYQKEIDKLITYPSSLKFNSKDEEWMSKMTLDFYLDLMKYDKNDPKAFKEVKIEKLLYDEVNAAKIEGGGRILFATKDGKFSIPSDADKSLVYVGFDKKFNQITEPICK